MMCSFICFAAKGYLDRRDDDPAAVVLLGDSAYHRSKLKDKLGLGLPVPQRKDGVQQKVRVRRFWSPLSDLDAPQGEEVARSHVVQSTRVVVEQVFADLKLWKVMKSNKVRTVKDFEQLLDCVSALHNLNQLIKLKPDFDLPVRRAAIPGEHIFKPLTPTNEVDLKIPKDPPDLSLPKYRHIKEFKEFLPSAAPAIRTAMALHGKDGVFFPTVRERGKHLYDGAYVLQLKVQHELLDKWTVKYVVGASYSYESHVGYFELSRDNAVIANICDCFSG